MAVNTKSDASRIARAERLIFSFDSPLKVMIFSLAASLLIVSIAMLLVDPESIGIALTICVFCAGPVSYVAGRFALSYRSVLEYKNEQLSLLNDQLEEKNSHLDAFARTVAHDLKQPINLSLGYVQLIKMHQQASITDENFWRMLDMIEDGTLATLDIVNNLLLLAKLESNQVNAHPIDMNALLTKVVKRLTPLAVEHQVSLNIAADLPPAKGHPIWIEQVWSNYLSNAYKYGGPQPQVSIKGKRLSCNEVQYYVCDQGPGIEPEDQKELFQEYQRLDVNHNDGHGLGLAIVKRIIERLGGRVGVMSEPGKGSCFYFTLPFQDTHEETGKVVTASREKTHSASEA